MGAIILGGVGIATGGVAFGVGALGLTLLGAGSGGVIGAATGETTVTVWTVPLYDPWVWGGLIATGAALIVVGSFNLQFTIYQPERTLNLRAAFRRLRLLLRLSFLQERIELGAGDIAPERFLEVLLQVALG